MMNLKSILVIAIMSVGVAFGQSEPAAMKLLKEVSNKYKSFKDFRVNYTFIMENLADSVYEEQKGTLYIKDEMFKLEMDNIHVYNNTKDVWTHMIEEEEATVSEFDPDEEGLSPKDIFNFYEQDDLMARIESEKEENGKTIQVVDLSPTGGDKPYFRIRLWIEKESKIITSSKVFEKMGGRYTYILEDFSPNQSLTDNFFSLDTAKYPDVEVVDLR
ncbi:outer membrane lipoprotein carrier protein LolA [bacterium AH-315-C07]|nr:outer membrane lipoprotein carrier protein LolA [bacterium AH-315-C07]